MSKRSSMSSTESRSVEGRRKSPHASDINMLAVEERAQWIQNLIEIEGMFESPVNINLAYTMPVQLTKLVWHHNDLPSKKMKMTNTGHTLILSAKWHQERPYLTDGPLLGNYVFSQLHFHWGETNMEGSEHTIDGSQMPLEMHVVLFKSCYLTQEAALKEKDGITVLAFFFKLQSNPNPAVQVLVDAIYYIQKPHTSARLEPLPLSFLLRPFVEDYYLYWGTVATSTCTHLILWLLSRVPIGISNEQLEGFRSMLDINEDPLLRNFRGVQPRSNRSIFHVNPGPSLFSTLLQVPREPFHYVYTNHPDSPSMNQRPTSPESSDQHNKNANDQNHHQHHRHNEQQVFRAETFCNNPFRYCGGGGNRPRSSGEYARHTAKDDVSDGFLVPRPRSARVRQIRAGDVLHQHPGGGGAYVKGTRIPSPGGTRRHFDESRVRPISPTNTATNTTTTISSNNHHSPRRYQRVVYDY